MACDASGAPASANVAECSGTPLLDRFKSLLGKAMRVAALAQRF